MLTKKAKYGLKAMVDLATQPPQSAAFIADIAQRNGIPKKFLDAILGELRNAGLLWSKKGRTGGYMLARPPEQITVGAIIRTLDGPLAPIACVSRSAFVTCRDCGDIDRCCVRRVMIDVREAISGVLDARTLAEMRDLAADDFAGFVYEI